MSTVSSFDHVIQSCNFNFRELLDCYDNPTLALATPALLYINVQGLIGNNNYPFTMRFNDSAGNVNIISGVSVSNHGFGNNVLAITGGLYPSTTQGGFTRIIRYSGGTAPMQLSFSASSVQNIRLRVYRDQGYRGIANLTYSQKDSYTEFMNSDGLEVGSALKTRKIELKGVIKNYDTSNLALVHNGSNEVRSSATSQFDVVDRNYNIDGGSVGELYLDNCTTTDGRSLVEVYFYCQIRPSGDITYSPREKRREIPFNIKVFYDSYITDGYGFVETMR